MTKQTLAAGLLAAGTPALAEAPDFNGTWTVQLVTEAGVCGSSFSYTVAIQDGQVRLASAGGSASITGRISERREPSRDVVVRNTGLLHGRKIRRQLETRGSGHH
jgi:hypothetical protein